MSDLVINISSNRDTWTGDVPVTTQNVMGTAVTEIFTLAIENEALRKQVAELQAWKDAVPVDAIRQALKSDLELDGEQWDEVTAWLATRPEVQP